MVNYMVEVGKISPNLGLGNARVEMYQVAGKPLLAEVAMYVGDRPIRKAQLLRSPLFELWYKMIEGETVLTFREMDESQRPDTLTLHAVWDDEEVVVEGKEEAEEGAEEGTVGQVDTTGPTTGMRMAILTPDIAMFEPVWQSPAKRALEEGQNEGKDDRSEQKKQAVEGTTQQVGMEIENQTEEEAGTTPDPEL